MLNGEPVDASTRTRLLRAGSELVYQQGYEATGVAQICTVAGARKGSFYHFWPSKRDLVLAGLEQSWVEHEAVVLNPAFNDAHTLAEGLQAWGDRLADVHGNHKQSPGGHVRGCRFGNLALEVATRDSTLRDAVRNLLEQMAQVLTQHVAAAIERGELSSVDPTAAGRTLVAHMEGLAVLAKVDNDPEVLRGLGGDCARLIGLSAGRPA